MSAEDAMVRIGFTVDDGEAEPETELLWASPLGDGTHVLENSPFVAYGVSWQDVVEARAGADSGALAYVRTVRKSGHRTVRAIVERAAQAERLVIAPMKRLGCSAELSEGRLLSIDVPPEVDLGEVARTLTDVGVTWEHADPTYESLYGDDEG